MRIWTERQIELRGVYEINLTSTALAALLASGHPALAEAKARRTHSGTKLHVGLLGASDWVLSISRVTPSNDCNPFHFNQGIVCVLPEAQDCCWANGVWCFACL